MAGMSISQVARQAGVNASTLRYYETIGLLPVAQRISGQRRYDESVLQRLTIIQTAQHAGFSLNEIGILLHDILPSASPSPQWREMVQYKLQELNKLLVQVQQMKNLLEDVMSCNDPELADCIYVKGQLHNIVEIDALP